MERKGDPGNDFTSPGVKTLTCDKGASNDRESLQDVEPQLAACREQTGHQGAALRLGNDGATREKKDRIAEEALSAFYDAQDAIEWARSPLSYSGEGQSRPRRKEDDDNTLRERRNELYVPVERLKIRHAAFAHLGAIAPKTVVHFGRDAGRPFHRMNEVFNRIHVAAFELISMAGKLGEPNKKHMDDLYKTIYMQYDGSDEIASEVNAAVSAIEEILLPQMGRSAGAWRRYQRWMRVMKKSSTPR